MVLMRIGRVRRLGLRCLLSTERDEYFSTQATTSRLTLDRSVICPVLVGRQGAINAAHATLDRARSGSGAILLVAGEAGIGKSRVLRETADAARESGFMVLQGACFEADRAVPFSPLLDVVRGLSVTASPAAVAHTFAPASAELVRAFPELASVFANVTSLEIVEPEQERSRLFHSIVETLSTLGRAQPVLLLIEDVHWGDEASLDMLLYVARKIAAQPVALVLSYRGDEVAPPLEHLLAQLDRTRIATDVELGRFSSTEMHAMLAAIFDGAAPGDGFVDTMHSLTDGNPFFVEEVLKALVTAGDVTRRADGAWQARPLARIQAPRTAVEAVRRRLSALSVPARDVASVAAVIGRRFDFAFLQSITGHDERALLAHIRELRAAQLVTEESPDRFAFRHALTREAILGELLARERSALHRAVADELERIGGASDVNIEALAYHAYGAMDWPRAVSASARAAEHALMLHAPREAIAHLDRAVDAAERAGQALSASLCLTRGRALETVGDWQGAHDSFTQAFDVARANNRDTDAWHALHALGLLWAARDYARAGEYRQRALDEARRIDDPVLIARSLNRVANWHVNIEQPAPAVRGHEEALALFEKIDDRRGVAETVDLLAMTHYIAGDLPSATATYLRALSLHEAIGDTRGVSRAIALLYATHGSTHTASTAFGESKLATDFVAAERSIKLAREIGWRAGESFVRFLVADALGWRGDYARALPMLDEAKLIAQEIDHLQWECGASRALASTLLGLEAPDRAIHLLERAHAIAQRLGSHTWTRWTAAPLAIALARLQRCDEATAILNNAAVASQFGRDALRPGDEDSPTLGERHIALARAEIALQSGDAQRALEIADARLSAEGASARARGDRAAGEVLSLTLTRALALIELEQFEAAELALRDARERALAHDARPLLWRVQAATGRMFRTQRRRVESRECFDEARKTANELAEQIDDQSLREGFLRAVDVLAPPAQALTSRQKAKAMSGGLTSRERDVARLVAQGKANRAIARALGIGERTVEGYVAAALAKLGFSTRSQLAAWTVQQGLGSAVSKRDA